MVTSFKVIVAAVLVVSVIEVLLEKCRIGMKEKISLFPKVQYNIYVLNISVIDFWVAIGFASNKLPETLGRARIYI